MDLIVGWSLELYHKVDAGYSGTLVSSKFLQFGVFQQSTKQHSLVLLIQCR